MIKLTQLKLNERNPRFIRDANFEKLKNSIKESPKFLQYRGIIVDDDNVILAGNMRYRALKELGYKEIPDEWVTKASELTEEEKRKFIVIDNVGYGEWDWDILAADYEAEQLSDWGVVVPDWETEADYSLLDGDSEVNNKLNDMSDGVKKAIQIEFESEHYNQAAELVKFWRNKGAYVGGMIIEHLKEEKGKL